MHEIEFFIAINDCGDFVINADDPADALSTLTADSGGDATKVIKIKLNVPLPKVAEVAGTLPDTDGPVSLTING